MQCDSVSACELVFRFDLIPYCMPTQQLKALMSKQLLLAVIKPTVNCSTSNPLITAKQILMSGMF